MSEKIQETQERLKKLVLAIIQLIKSKKIYQY